MIGLLMFVRCFTPKQDASVSHRRICFDGCTRFHTETEAADQICDITQAKCIYTGTTSRSVDPVTLAG